MAYTQNNINESLGPSNNVKRAASMAWEAYQLSLAIHRDKQSEASQALQAAAARQFRDALVDQQVMVRNGTTRPDRVVPTFASVENRPTPERSRQEPDRKEVVRRRVLLAVECGADTFQKIRKAAGDAETNELYAAIRMLKETRQVEQDGRRYYRIS